jgi:hypothetical protein
MEFRLVFDDEARRWSRLAGDLGGRGVAGIDAALRELELRPVRDPFRALLETGPGRNAAEPAKAFATFLDAAARFASRAADRKEAEREFQARLSAMQDQKEPAKPVGSFLWAWLVLRSLCGSTPSESPAVSWVDEWMLADIVRARLQRSGWSERSADPAPGLLVFLITAGSDAGRTELWPDLLGDPAARRFLEVNLFEGVQWFSKEALELMTDCIRAVASLEGWETPDRKGILRAASLSGYRWEDFLERLRAADAAEGPPTSEER